MWHNKAPLSRFRGKELMKEKLYGKSDPSCSNFIIAFKLWPDLYKFLVKQDKGWLKLPMQNKRFQK